MAWERGVGVKGSKNEVLPGTQKINPMIRLGFEATELSFSQRLWDLYVHAHTPTRGAMTEGAELSLYGLNERTFPSLER